MNNILEEVYLLSDPEAMPLTILNKHNVYILHSYVHCLIGPHPRSEKLQLEQE